MLPDLVSFYNNKDLTLPEEALHTQPSLCTAVFLLLSQEVFDTLTRPVHQKNGRQQ